MSEGSSTKRAIVIGVASTVIGGLVLSVLLWLGALFYHPVREFLVEALKAVVQAITREVALPAWGLVLLLALAVVAPLAALWAMKLWRDREAPRPTDYTRDDFFGIRWEWTWLLGDLREPVALCPNEGAVLVRKAGRDRQPRAGPMQAPMLEPLRLECDLCYMRFGGDQGFNGDTVYSLQELESKVRLRIDAKLRSGEWRDVVQAQQEKGNPNG